ncbi:MAG: GGDEF domain-containing protein, partial [Flavobacteriales bacterium]
NQLLTTISMIQAASLQDPLTKAANWRYFEQYSSQLLQQAGRDNIKMTIAYIDVDNFKKINDSFGHGVGDEVLIQIAQTIQSQIRSQDMIARLGGDEFAVVLNNTDFTTSQEILDRIRRATLQEMQAKNWDVTLSIGAMVFSVLPMTITPMLKMVDNLMYDLKKNGKDNIKILEQDMRFF